MDGVKLDNQLMREVWLSRLFGVVCSVVSEEELMMERMFNEGGRWSYLYTDDPRSTRDPDGGHASVCAHRRTMPATFWSVAFSRQLKV
jgi:hypothetical protein